MSKNFYWIIAYMDNQPYLIGGNGGEQGVKTEEEAKTNAFQLGLTNFQIKAYPTMNMQAASAFFRGKRVNETKNLREASRRIKHKIRRYR
jgi:hypothetical protein